MVHPSPIIKVDVLSASEIARSGKIVELNVSDVLELGHWCKGVKLAASDALELVCLRGDDTLEVNLNTKTDILQLLKDDDTQS